MKSTKQYLGKLTFQEMADTYPVELVKTVMHIGTGNVYKVNEHLENHVDEKDVYDIHLHKVTDIFENDIVISFVFTTEDNHTWVIKEVNGEWDDGSYAEKIKGAERTVNDREVIEAEYEEVTDGE